jgi:hypothetical protein
MANPSNACVDAATSCDRVGDWCFVSSESTYMLWVVLGCVHKRLGSTK